ncbi:hypothetical protein D9757_001544 [Collybiopsis confluens]|uniref:Methyltransferase type 11 domain-containing protein n=1 Tax=Collybiopsis confluens TaxID=2823264 RepID=A0A8H5HZQ1_9AGAR|nr:hypothetical protein D9757_001544 [Collybiopsis confluens]
MTVHSIAQQGFGVGTNEVYDRARPSYQSSVLAQIHQSIPKERSAPFNIAEIGAGTGIFTRALLAHPDWNSSIAEIRAVEPSSGMRAQFEKTVSSSGVKVSAKEGSFTDTGIEDGWADIVVIAQAYHWAHPNYDGASKEFARILRPSGIVVYVWNLEDSARANWIAQLRDLYEKYEGGSPQFRLGLWRVTFDSPIYSTLFKSQVEQAFEWSIPTTVEAVLERVTSKSYIAILAQDKKEEYGKLISEAQEMLGREEKKWIDKDAGVFEYPYKTTLIIAQKK